MEFDSYIRNELAACHREPAKMQLLWGNKTQFGKRLSLALTALQQACDTSNLQDAADYFIAFTSVFLVRENNDLRKIAACLEKAEVDLFMEYYFMNTLIANDMIFSILSDENLITELGHYEEWIEYPLMLRAKKVIDLASNGAIDQKDIIPSVPIDTYLQEYLLSWAYEEGKLSQDGLAYFKSHFSKKYEMLCSIMSKQMERNNV